MEPSSVDARAGSFTCLVADDSEFARKSISKVVTTIGGSVVAEASNGLEACELYQRHAPDLVLLDVTMPFLDGVETLRRILEENRNAKVIMVSAVGHKEMVWKAICLGAKHYMTKPYTPDYAGMIIKAVIGGGGTQ